MKKVIFKLPITNSFAIGSNQFTCTVFRLKIDSNNKHICDNRRVCVFWHDHERTTASLNAGSQRPRMYGLPKIHKKDVPFRPILSMTGSAQHQLATWLTSVLQPVLFLYSSYCIQDSFSFVNAIRSSNLQPASTFMCSFDISSLFTNVPLAETIQICADSLYNFLPTPPTFPRNVFVELMELATCSVDFSFINIMHRQIDGVAMGSPLGPCLANIFVGFYKSKLFQTTYVLPLR